MQLVSRFLRSPLAAAALAFSVPSAVSMVAPARAESERTFELDGHHLKVPDPILFETGSDALKPESAPALAHVAAYLGDKSSISLMRVEVHSDSQGNGSYNQTLTEKRALAVARALVGKGVDCKRLIPVGFGDSKPVAPNDSADGRAQNRRTVFANAMLRGRAIGGMPVDGGGRVAGDPCQ
jgi:OOP family OmpA-OmpF porin